jgi:hypothetical protein
VALPQPSLDGHVILDAVVPEIERPFFNGLESSATANWPAGPLGRLSRLLGHPLPRSRCTDCRPEPSRFHDASDA